MGNLHLQFAGVDEALAQQANKATGIDEAVESYIGKVQAKMGEFWTGESQAQFAVLSDHFRKIATELNIVFSMATRTTGNNAMNFQSTDIAGRNRFML